MEKMNRVIFLLKALPVVVIFLLLLPNSNRILYAQTPSPSATPTSAPNANQNQSQSLSRYEFLTLIIGTVSAIGAILSGFGFAGWRKSKSLEVEFLKLVPVISPIIERLIDQTKDEEEKKRLLVIKKDFEDKFLRLRKQKRASQEARKWLSNNRENLADQAVAHALANESCPQNVRDKFRLNINRYLYGIQESLDIGDFDFLHELDIEEALTKSFYEKALNFILEEKVSKNKNLSADEITEMKKYFDYTIQNVL
ncbi:MAG: hypothetical protein QNJ63_15120 [Calothrix sp. MO_192.B10]|nr:hypothetical protein [Calothrix sp. MO_192.B10]